MSKSRMEPEFLLIWREDFRSLPEPVHNYRFDPVRRWELDYAWPELLVAVELDGGTHKIGGGNHNRPAGQARDYEKANAAILDGWCVFRFNTPMWMDDREGKGRTACVHTVAAMVMRRLEQLS